ncbi:TetR/AcrR family transcriptional regulator [Sutcliffiella halmapala]|uniref:TetR/AcrR family transcriptional regulator n=1 Tax=Sutcliffiella halmapala TaxID=79882 RepID=UPI0009949D55|nr:TetR/AcrR family transcriptional regulator [Sutcliffiella halmapala]
MLKKKMIMEKALDLFAKQGFEATSVQQITDYCGISKGAFYLSFKSKDELILGIIDYFMEQITSDIDYIVKGTSDEEDILYLYYHAMFDSFYKHSDFAKIFIKEQMQSVNKELIGKFHYYDSLMDKSILALIERLYGEEVEHIKYDLVYCVKGLANVYSTLFLFNDVPLDVNLLSRSLVEKTNILAKHTTVPFVSQEHLQMFHQPMTEEVTKESILEMLEQIIDEMEESIEKESLILLKEQLLERTLSPAIVRGLLENIRNHSHCKWISYLLRQHFEI